MNMKRAISNHELADSSYCIMKNISLLTWWWSL